MTAKRIIVDANLLLLWVAWTAGGIYSHRRLRRFRADHATLLNAIIGPYEGIVVTPHSLAELWNLIGEDRGAWDQDRKSLLASAHELVASAIEIFLPASALVLRREIDWLGLADVAQIAAAIEGGFALTSADGPLCSQALTMGVEVHHFWQLSERF